MNSATCRKERKEGENGGAKFMHRMGGILNLQIKAMCLWVLKKGVEQLGKEGSSS